ncbi:M14 family metallopeptidase [Kallotenue papyrolyticum]|uniref:M14 family metallopeptidase n=1 Tax=Kallotenue papyrolyticum TaxID=1325125 RepID=UPI000478546E|nr:M14 family metallopeptidase [Kallotenue papyrolyticum]
MPDLRFDTYYRYDDLTRILHAFAEEYPQLVRIESIGRSHEGRDIWLLTVTNFASGAPADKPALWVDGNIHASEVSPSSACLYLLQTLVTGYGARAEVTRCLDTRVFYICPRINPDGAEWALADHPKIIRSSTRPYPYDEEPIEGLIPEDIDGDGRLLMMRIPDPNGGWKVSEQDPRLLVRRDPTETGGQYYRVIPEGRLENYDGVTIRPAPRKEGLDLNRNFPANWRLEGEQKGAGPFPASEPEVRAVVNFIAGHPNITGGVSFHTYSGVLLRPFSGQSDEAFPPEDLWTYQKIGQRGTELTGYPNVSVFHDFRYHPKEVITGAFDDWMYEHRGLFSWTVEIWSPQREAGIQEYKFIDWYREHPLEDDLKLLRWSDEQLGGKGYVAWYPFEHPQLGRVELGGWDHLFAWRNPPTQFLEREVARFPEWLLWHLLISPKLEIYDASVTPLSDETFLVRLVVHNTGWLPSYITKRALEKKLVRGVIAEIELPAAATLVSGKPREELGQLEGRAYQPSAIAGWGAGDTTADRTKVEWVVRAPQGGRVRLTARHERAGRAQTELELQPRS